MDKYLHNRVNSQCRSEAGFTLIEMMVAMTIASVFFVSFTAVVVATIQTMKTGDQRTVAQQNGRIAINFLADDIKQMSELESPSYSEYRDPRTGGFPTNGECEDSFFNEVYPFLRQSTDGSLRGYIDLNHRDASGGVDEYEDFRSDGMPYDVRPLFPNKINFKMNQASYFPHTRYSNMNPSIPGGIIDIDGTSMDALRNFDNAQAADVRVTFEHQKQPPRWGLLEDEGLLKNLHLPILGSSGGGVNLFKKPFVLLRSFEIENVTGGGPNHWGFNESFKFHNLVDPLGNDSGIDLTRPSEDLRQIVADHIADIRFRYFHIRGGEWIEIRYDPHTEHVAQGHTMPSNINDGYYRYYTKYGDEIFSWATPDGDLNLPPANSTRAEIIEHWKDEDPSDDRYTFMPTNEFERGLLLFEGWRYVNTIMITIKAANTELQENYFTSISHDIISGGDTTRPDWGLGFVDFQKGASRLDDRNEIDPLWHALDSYREGVVIPGDFIINPGDSDVLFDFVDPNGNAGFDPGRFVTLQTIVSPPVLYSTSREAAGHLRMGLSFL